MKQNLTVVITNETNPYHNIALEEYLLHSVGEQECILYLWQNRNTVVIGRNQHAENECRIQSLRENGGFLARRLSGGGAVYHDLGNLNFTFLAHEDNFDVSIQNEVILQAVKQLGVQAEKNGRNDLTADGKKFSGHAYYKTGGRCYHHGTLMVDVDHTKLASYLNVSPLKLNAKGVRSVRSRVANLVDFNPDITVSALKMALIDTFSKVYGQRIQVKTDSDFQNAPLNIEKFSSEQWIMGNCAPLEHSREARFDWGTIRVDYTERNGSFSEVRLWSDGLEADLLSRIPDVLRGCRMEPDRIQGVLSAEAGPDSRIAQDLTVLLTEK